MKINLVIAIGIALAVIITVIIAGIITIGKEQEGYVGKNKAYVFDRNSKIGMKDVRIYSVLMFTRTKKLTIKNSEEEALDWLAEQ